MPFPFPLTHEDRLAVGPHGPDDEADLLPLPAAIQRDLPGHGEVVLLETDHGADVLYSLGVDTGGEVRSVECLSSPAEEPQPGHRQEAQEQCVGLEPVFTGVPPSPSHPAARAGLGREVEGTMTRSLSQVTGITVLILSFQNFILNVTQNF